jgi:hypothetical protein
VSLADRLGMTANIPKAESLAEVDEELGEWLLLRPMRHDNCTPLTEGHVYTAWRTWGNELLDRRLKAKLREVR